MKKFFRILMWTCIALVFVGTFVYLFISSQSKPEEYQLVSPAVTDIQRTTVLTGAIEPRDKIEIKPQVSGIIAEVNVEAGDMVREGDVIARIKVIPDESQLSSAQNRVAVAKVDLEQKRLAYERTKSLYDKKYESRDQLEQDESAYRKAQEELASAIDALSIVRDGVSATNAQGSNTLVRATITGLVLDVPIKVGSSVIQANTMNDGTTIATIADMNNLIFKGKIDETEVGLLHEGMPMEISVGAVGSQTLNATIEKIAPQATEDNGTNTFEVKAAVTPADGMYLRSGYSANATVILERVESALAIPESVIEFAGDSTFVYVLADSLAKPMRFDRTAVKTGISDGINIQLKDSTLTTASLLRGAKITE
ncbi:MAG: efflux RND transporter periplasmic adaptor subunit [Bacteroidales bacterium]|nr:efflux RND transporter periplasmic adaptor subunit [Bacteroidales bacterium]